nr:non-ribosomal peptide synthetase [uncultured Lachnoclostridium sp.]
MYTLKKLLKDSFLQNKEKIAISTQAYQITYQTLEFRADAIGHKIERAGIKEQSCVACISHQVEHYIYVLMACVKYNLVFMPVSAKFPHDRCLEMLKESEASVIVCDSNLNDEVDGFIRELKTPVKRLDIEQAVIPADTPSAWKEAADTARSYIYFTSGSQGKPKGIVGQVKGIAQFITWEAETFATDISVRVAQVTPPCHDPFLRDVLLPLHTGGTICIPENDRMLLDSQELAKWMEKEKVTLLHCTPSMFQILSAVPVTKNSFPDLQVILLAGELLKPNCIKNWFSLFHDRMKFVNLYGPTETTLAKLFHIIKESDLERNVIPVGNTIPGARALVVSEGGRICRTGQMGEVWIRTPYRTLGYIAKEINADKFIQNPFNSKPGDIVYKTGDLGKWLENDEIELLGRIDRQVKLRGHRIELSEVEAALQEYEGVEQAAVIYLEERETLYGFVQSTNEGEDIEETEILSFIRSKLPDYMTPEVIKVLTSLPINMNAKLDYGKLKELANKDKREIIEPVTPLEKQLSEICKNIFSCSEVSMEDTLFRIGANSVNILRLVNEVNSQTNSQFTLFDIFENRNRTIRELADVIEKNREAGHSKVTITKAEPKEYYKAVPEQRRIFVLQNMDKESTNYNITRAIQVKGSITNQEIVEQAETFLQRYELFQITFQQLDNEIVQRVGNFRIKAERIYCKEKEVTACIHRFRRPFDLEQEPGIRLGLIETDKDNRILVVDVHHIILDGHSINRLIQKFCLFLSGVEGQKEKVTYLDYAVWVNENEGKKARNESLAYWKEKFRVVPEPVMPYCIKKRPSVFTYRGMKESMRISSKIKEGIVRLAKENNTTEFAILTTAFVLLLEKYTLQNDITIGTVTNGRVCDEIKDTLGMFVKTLPLRIQIDQENTLDQVITHVNEVLGEAYEHQAISFEELLEELGVERDMSRNPLFDYMIVMQEDREEETVINGTEWALYPYDDLSSKYDLTLEIRSTEEEYLCVFEYCTDIFDAGTIELLKQHFVNLLGEMIEGERKPVNRIRMVSDEEQQKILSYSQMMHLDNKPANAVEQFRKEAQTCQEQVAVIEDDRKLTYQELEQKSDRLAGYLLAHHIEEGERVGIYGSHSIEMIVGILAVLKCKAAYVPIDSQLPEERIQYILEDSKARFLLSDGTGSYTWEEGTVLDISQTMTLDIETVPMDTQDISQKIAYIIYTSGSTGKPKGVQMTHQNLMTYIKAFREYVIDKQPFVMTQMASISFDVSIEEIFGTLLNGGTLILIKREQMLDLKVFQQIVEEHQVDYVSASPAFASVLNKCENSLPIRTMIVGGENVLPHYVDHLSDSMHIINSYGPTETCVGATYCVFDKNVHSTDFPIGKPLPGYNVYILNGYDAVCGFQTIGEICISGKCVSEGYVDSALNEGHFCIDKLTGERMYRSGDLGYMNLDGQIEFVARKDNQVKVRGYRIECDEIIQNAIASGLVEDMVVEVYENEAGVKQLCAAYTSPADVEEKLREVLSKKLPAYMVPDIMIRLDTIPITQNGKTDSNKIKELIQKKAPKKLIKYPVTKQEKELAAIWSKILKKEDISIQENFWSAGGNSILALSMISEALNAGFQFTIKDLFANLTLEELARKQQTEHIPSVGQVEEDKPLEETISVAEQVKLFREKFPRTTVESREVRPSFVQMFYLGLNPQYISDVVTIKGDYTGDQIRSAVEILIKNQEQLRCGYEINSAEDIRLKVYQYKENRIFIPYLDISSYTKEEQNHHIKAVKQTLKVSRMDVDLPYCLFVVKMEQDVFHIYIDIQHAFYDMFSNFVVKEEIVKTLSGNSAFGDAEKSEVKMDKNDSKNKENNVREHFQLDRFFKASNTLRKLTKIYPKEYTRLTKEYSIEAGISEKEIMYKSYELALDYLFDLFETEELPTWFIFHGRKEQDYQKIGAYLDMIPLLVDRKQKEVALKLLEQNLEYVKQEQINIADTLLAEETTEKQDVSQLRKMMKEQFIVMNYQGEQEASEQEQQRMQSLDVPIYMAVMRYKKDKIYITYVMPVNPE